MHSILNTVDSTFVEAPIYDAVVVLAAAVLEVLGVVHQVLLE